jgi:hypothetical protein
VVADDVYRRGPVTALRGEALLRRADGSSWAIALEPVVRDTVDIPAEANLGLGVLDDLIGFGLAELARHPLPAFAIAIGPDDELDLEPIAFVSLLVAHRAERLFQLTELAAAALDNLEHGGLEVAAITARSLFEIAAVSNDVHDRLLQAWADAHDSPDAVRTVATRKDTPVWSHIWGARYGTRGDGKLEGWPSATNTLSRLGKFGRRDPTFQAKIDRIYTWLSEAAHPNVESNAVYWRKADADRKGRQRIELAPSRSHSPVKAAIVDAVRISYSVILAYCRDLWWVAAETVSVCPIGAAANPSMLGLPRVTGRNEPCCCGSGMKTKTCSHPEPPPPSEVIHGRV